MSRTLDEMRVRDVMSAPVVSCAPDVPLREVAELMARHRIHCVVVLADPVRDDTGGPWGVIAELDLVGAAPFDDEVTTAGRVAGTPVVTVERDDSLARAALLMSEYATTHLVVIGADGTPEGIISALDLAVAVAPPPPRAKVEEGEGPAPELRATVGDRLLIHPHHLGEPERDGEILDAQGPGGSAPFLVRWEDTGRVSLYYPGSDARIHHLARG